jgi:hypothetical protein
MHFEGLCLVTNRELGHLSDELPGKDPRWGGPVGPWFAQALTTNTTIERQTLRNICSA